MRHLLWAALPAKLAVLLVLGGVIAALAAPPVDFPEAADPGQSRAEAGSANAAQAAGVPADAGSDVGTTGAHVEDVTATLEANLTRLLETLQLVLDERADEHAADALEAVIERLSTDNIGLTRAAEAVSGAGAPADLPAAAGDHPSAGDHAHPAAP